VVASLNPVHQEFIWPSIEAKRRLPIYFVEKLLSCSKTKNFRTVSERFYPLNGGLRCGGDFAVVSALACAGI